MMWSHRAIEIYMGDIMAREPRTGRRWDIGIEPVAGEVRLRADESIDERSPRRAGWLARARSAVAGRSQVARS